MPQTFTRDPDALSVLLRMQPAIPHRADDGFDEMISEGDLFGAQEAIGARGAASGGAYAIPSRESLRDSGVSKLKQLFGIQQAEAEAKALPSRIAGQSRIEQEQIRRGGVDAQTVANSREKQLDRESRERIAGANSEGGWAEPTVGIPQPGTGAMFPVPRSIAANPQRAVEFIKQYEDAGLQGSRGQADRTKIDAFNTLIDALGETYQAGEAAKWNGVGPVEGRTKSALYNWLGVGNDAEETFRTRLGRLKAREAFAEGGKQFTDTEQRLIDEFIAGANKSGPVAKLRLDETLNHARNTLRNLGVPDDIIEARIQKALGASGVAPQGTASQYLPW